MKDTVHLNDFTEMVKRNKKKIILINILTIAITIIIVHFFLSPKYCSTIQMIGRSNNSVASNSNLQNDINGNVLLVNTYKDIITGEIVLSLLSNEIKKQHDYSFTEDELKKIIEVQQSPNSQIFNISVTSKSPRQSSDIVYLLSDIFQKKMRESLDDTQIEIQVLGQTRPKKIFPNEKLILSLSIVAGFLLGVLFAFLRESFNKTIIDETFNTFHGDIPILGIIPEISKKELRNEFDCSENPFPIEKLSTSRRKKRRTI